MSLGPDVRKRFGVAQSDKPEMYDYAQARLGQSAWLGVLVIGWTSGTAWMETDVVITVWITTGRGDDAVQRKQV